MTASSTPGAEPAPHVLKLRAYAKINLDLRIGPIREDGFHDLTTVLQSVALHDTVTLRAVEGPCQVRCTAPGVPQDRDNLVWRAAQSLWLALGRRGEPRGVTATIVKRIPIEAGLGGGTSDAVSSLRGLCRLWKAAPPPELLRDVAADVGADGPFFLIGGTALGVGRGDEIYPLVELSRQWVVIIVPALGVPTAHAYAWLDRDVTAARRRRAPPVIGSRLDLTALTNDLERPVFRRRSEIREAAHALAGAGALVAAMTGSGSAVFGLFATRARALEASAVARQLGWRVVCTQTISREHLAREA